MDTKLCTKCGVKKVIKEFNKNKNHPSGYHSWCKVCQNESQRAAYLKSEKRKIRAERWEKTKKDKLIAIRKKCSLCGVIKVKDYYYNNKRAVDGKDSKCKDCTNRINSKNRKKYQIQKYGITIDKYQEIWDSQQGRCAHCGKKSRLCIDHDHVTGKVRGLLCVSCNSSLGALGDDAESIEKLISYLRGNGV